METIIEEKVEPIHVTKAIKMNKTELTYFVFGQEYTDTYIDINLPGKYWTETYYKKNKGQFHSPSYVFDTKINKPVNLIEKGIKKKLIYKTNQYEA